jgi:hypothetical protein
VKSTMAVRDFQGRATGHVPDGTTALISKLQSFRSAATGEVPGLTAFPSILPQSRRARRERGMRLVGEDEVLEE